MMTRGLDQIIRQVPTCKAYNKPCTCHVEDHILPSDSVVRNKQLLFQTQSFVRDKLFQQILPEHTLLMGNEFLDKELNSSVEIKRRITDM